MSWREDPPTAPQLRAIGNMSAALDKVPDVPKTKGEACDLISSLTEEMRVTSFRNTRHRYSYDYPDSRRDWNEAMGGW